MKDVYDLLDEWMDKISTADGKTNQAEAANELKLLMKDKPANAILNEFANMFATQNRNKKLIYLDQKLLNYCQYKNIKHLNEHCHDYLRHL